MEGSSEGSFSAARNRGAQADDARPKSTICEHIPPPSCPLPPTQRAQRGHWGRPELRRQHCGDDLDPNFGDTVETTVCLVHTNDKACGQRGLRAARGDL